jgi:DNA-binding SARP family transcriptional activator
LLLDSYAPRTSATLRGRVADIEVRVLGQPQVVVNGAVAPLTGRQLLLATRLALAHPIAVARHRLLADVWPDETASDGAVRVALTRLRGALGADVVCRQNGGYILSSRARVDAERFERLLRVNGSGAEAPDRLAAIDEALRLWRGVPFDGLERVPWVESETIRLEELREQAIDERFALLLDMDEPSRLVPDLRGEFERDPTRERRAELLALALYRSGRQADALAAIDRTRDALRDRLGLDPGPALRQLELRILRHDDDLGGAAPAPASRVSTVTKSTLRTAAALAKVGAFEEAHAVLDTAIAEARERRDARGLAKALLAAARTSQASGHADPHPLIDEAREIARQLEDGPLLARCALVRFGSGTPTDKSQALVDLMEPLDLLPVTAPEHLDLLAAAAVLLLFIDGSDAADRLLAAAERLHDAAPSARSESVWLTARSIVGSVRGVDPELVDQSAARALDLARASGQTDLVVVAIQARLRALYTAGDLDTVDTLMGELDRSAREAALPFGIVRVTLCQATNALARGRLDEVPPLIATSRAEGKRLRTFAAEGAAFAQEVLLLLELDQLADVATLVRPLAADSIANSWHSILALCEDEGQRTRLRDVATQVRPDDDSFSAFVAVAAEVAARTGDAELGAWCLSHLDGRGDTTIVVGLGTLVMGFARFFAGLARVATGKLDGAARDFEAAAGLAIANGARLWHEHATVELAGVLAQTGADADRARGRKLLDGITPCSPRVRRRYDEVSAVLDGDRVGAALLR